MTSKITVSGGTTTAELRNNPTWDSSDQINDLNQIMRNDTVTSPSLYNFAVVNTNRYNGGTVTLTNRYTYDLSGNMTSITPWVPITGDISNGSNTVSGVSPTDIANVTVGAGVQNAAFPSGTVVDTVGASSFTVSNNATATASGATLFVSTAATTFTWDQDNRLTQVTLPDSTMITYTYDVQGRMLTRTDTFGTTLFEWDGMDCVRETAPSTGSAIYDTSTYDGSSEYGSGGMTQYYVVNGALRQLIRDNAAYAVICDALGNVRLVLDDTGAIVSSFQYDAWGNVLAYSYDNLPGGMPYRFVGALGCRWEGATGLTYMRQRWYSGPIGIFISRDQSMPGVTYGYVYASGMPNSAMDVSGRGAIQCSNINNPTTNPAKNVYQGLIENVCLYQCEYNCYDTSTGQQVFPSTEQAQKYPFKAIPYTSGGNYSGWWGIFPSPDGTMSEFSFFTSGACPQTLSYPFLGTPSPTPTTPPYTPPSNNPPPPPGLPRRVLA